MASDPDKVSKIVSRLDLKIHPRDLKSKDFRQLLSTIFSQWLSLSTCIIQTAVDVVPPPSEAQGIRIPKMLYPDLHEPTVVPKNQLEKSLYSCDSRSEANVVALVSKMFAVPDSDLPENKKQALTAEELRARAKALREAKKLAEEQGDAANSASPSVTPAEPTSASPGDTREETAGPGENLLGFARIYSGTIVEGAKVFCVLPKYNHLLGPAHPRNQEHLVTATIERLYTMMGRELVRVPSVCAGNVFAIKGLEGKVWRNATICSPNQSGVGDAPDVDLLKECLVNLGGVSRMVCGILGDLTTY